MGLQDGDLAMEQHSAQQSEQAGSMQSQGGNSTEPVQQATSQGQTQQQTQQQVQQQVQELLDLGKHSKFKWDDKEWTLDDLKKSIMYQRDYTKKSQNLAKERELTDHYRADLRSLIKNPQLIDEFKKLYPSEWVERATEDLSSWQSLIQELRSGESDKGDAQKQASMIDPALLNEIKQLKNELGSLKSESFESKVSAAKAELDATISEMTQKYPRANVRYILSQAESLRQERQPLTKEVWEELFKSDHSTTEKTWKTWLNEQFKNQKTVSDKSRDMQVGGGIAGQAPRKMTLDEAEQAAIQHFQR